MIATGARVRAYFSLMSIAHVPQMSANVRRVNEY